MKHKYAYGVDDAGGATAFYVVDSYEGCGRVRIDEGIAKLKDVCDTCGNACRMAGSIGSAPICYGHAHQVFAYGSIVVSWVSGIRSNAAISKVPAYCIVRQGAGIHKIVGPIEYA